MTKEWGDAEAALAEAPVRIEQEYRTPREYNVPIEPHGLIAQWEGDMLTIWEPSQWVDGMARTYAEWFGMPVRECAHGFALYRRRLRLQGALPSRMAPLPPIAAKMLGASGQARRDAAADIHRFRRPAGDAADHRARRDARRQAAVDRASQRQRDLDGRASRSSRSGSVTSIMYAAPNFSRARMSCRSIPSCRARLRAPGENPSAFGIECAIDELAYEVGIDPLEIRLLNYAEEDPHAKKPWSTRQLREAFAAGAEAFGWSKRSPSRARCATASS